MNSSVIGCCGWPEGKQKYFAHYPVVELQSTFYNPPSVVLAEKWRALAPSNFQFCMKAWQLITHAPNSTTYRKLKIPISPTEVEELGSFRPTEHVALAWERTAEIAHALQATVVLFQCPASFTPTGQNIRNLYSFFKQIGSQPFRLAWEPRGDWPSEVIQQVCGDLNLIHCVDPFKIQSVTHGPTYWRLHGIGGYHYHYSSSDLLHLQAMQQTAEAEGRTPLYMLFNNVWMKDDSHRYLTQLKQIASSPD